LIDESLEGLGSTLKLPAWFEQDREAITRTLPTITIPRGDMT